MRLLLCFTILLSVTSANAKVDSSYCDKFFKPFVDRSRNPAIGIGYKKYWHFDDEGAFVAGPKAVKGQKVTVATKKEAGLKFTETIITEPAQEINGKTQQAILNARQTTKGTARISLTVNGRSKFSQGEAITEIRQNTCIPVSESVDGESQWTIKECRTLYIGLSSGAQHTEKQSQTLRNCFQRLGLKEIFADDNVWNKLNKP